MARDDLHFRLRIPEDLKKLIEKAAVEHDRSMTAEMVARLEQTFSDALFIPQDLLDRVRAYAARQGRSVNEEIERLLEREYPEQWPIDDRMEYLAAMLAILKSGTADKRIDFFLKAVEETVEGIVTGRVKGVNSLARSEVTGFWRDYKTKLSEEEIDNEASQYDEEELEHLWAVGRPEKLADPLPDPKRDFHDVMYLLPPDILSEFAARLNQADVEGAAELISSINREDLARYVQEEATPLIERDRRRSQHEVPFSDRNEDPFEEA